MTAAPPAALPRGLDALASALAAGALGLDACLDELERWHAMREPEVLALLAEPARFARLRGEAAALAVRYPGPSARPPLFGVPVAVKDVFRVHGFPTRAGSRLPAELFAGPEASSIGRLRAAGALVLGKAVSTEFAYFAPGPTRNPHDPERTPGGSSSGSAAAVGAGLAPLALGTQTIGSIGRPAAFCGVFGFKPTRDRIPTDGVIPLAPSLDTMGFFTADAAGAARAARVLCTGWRAVERVAPPVLAIPDGPYLDSLEPEGRAHFARTCARLEAAGFALRRVAVMADFAAIATRHRRIVAAECARVHTEWYARFAPLYDPRTAELIETGRGVEERVLADDLAGRERLRGALAAAMDAHGIDVFVSPPARGPAPLGLGATGDPVMNLPWTHAGVPTLVVPAGRGESGMPMGLQLAARFGADEELLAWAPELAAAVADPEPCESAATGPRGGGASAPARGADPEGSR